MLLACQLKIIKVVLQLQHNNLLSIIWSSNDRSLIEYWNSCFIEFMYVYWFFDCANFVVVNNS